MDFEGAIKYLENFYSYEKINEIKYGEDNFNLDRLKKFLYDLELDFSRIKFVHVAGSKGKGSVSTLIKNYLSEVGFSVGLFTSPHMVDVRERIVLGNEMISKEKFVELISNLKDAFDTSNLTYFEVLTVLALRFFVDESVDYAVMEVGLGGRLDSTNIIDPELSVITTIEKEHTNILGETYEEIVPEKLGIVKKNKAVLIGFQNDEVFSIIKNSLESHTPVYYVKDLEFEVENSSLAQVKNATVAFNALSILLGEVDQDLFSKVVTNFKLIGRFDVRDVDGKIVVFDMAHTERSIENLISSLKYSFPEFSYVFLFSLMKGKNVRKISELIKSEAEKVVCTNSNLSRGVEASYLGDLMGVDFLDDPFFAYETLFNALKKDQVLVVTGSHFLVSKILPKLS